MLSNPVLDNAVNIEAARMFEVSPHAYQQMVSECIMASQKLEGIERPKVTIYCLCYQIDTLKIVRLCKFYSVYPSWLSISSN